MEAPRHLYRHAFQLRILLGEIERERGYVTYTCPMSSCSEVLSLGFPQTSVSCFLNGQHSIRKKEREREREQENTIQ